MIYFIFYTKEEVVVFTSRDFASSYQEKNTALRMASSNKTEWMFSACRRMNKKNSENTPTLFDFSHTDLTCEPLFFSSRSCLHFLLFCAIDVGSLTWRQSSHVEGFGRVRESFFCELFGGFPSLKNQLTGKTLKPLHAAIEEGNQFISNSTFYVLFHKYECLDKIWILCGSLWNPIGMTNY